MSDYAIQIVLMVVNTLTLIVLLVYTWETRRIRKAAWQQAESAAKPCLTLWSKLRDPSEAILETDGAVGNTKARGDDATFVVHNIGTGVALNVNYFFRSLESGRAADPSKRYFVSVLAGQKIAMPEPMNTSSYCGECELVFQFESIGGIKYQSLIRMNHHVLTQFDFRALGS
jgi:hypothetical protein